MIPPRHRYDFINITGRIDDRPDASLHLRPPSRRIHRSFFLTCCILGTCILGMLPLASISAAQAQSSAPTASTSKSIPGTFTPAPLDSGYGPLDPSLPQGITPQQIVARFAAKESQFKRALDDYTYRRTVKFDTIDEDGSVDGEYLQVDDIVFTTTGQKHEQVVYAPDNTLTRVAISPSDFDDIEHRLPFTLTTEDVGLYRVSYVGKQSIDQVPMYVFDVAPKQMVKGERYFLGRIWVDTHDFQIVVTNGRNIPDDTRRGHEDLSIPFTTYRQQIDGKYWFPVYTRAEGTLHFENCKQCLPEDVHLKEIVKYGQYKRFGSDIHILYGGVDLADGKSLPSPTTSPAAGPQTASSQPGATEIPAPAGSPGAAQSVPTKD